MLDLADARFHHSLLVLRLVVLRVLAEVAELARALQPLCHLLPTARPQLVDLRLQPVERGLGQPWGIAVDIAHLGSRTVEKRKRRARTRRVLGV